MYFSEKTAAEIDKLYKNRKHVELTIGIYKEGQKEIIHWGPDRQEKSDELVYPVGSICKPFTTSLLAKYISEGKLAPAQRENALSLCLSNQDMFISLYENAPSIVDTNPKPRSHKVKGNVDKMVDYFKN